MKFWERWKQRKHEAELRQVHRLKREVVGAMLAEVGSYTIEAVLTEMTENKKRFGHAGYTSLANIWVEAQNRREDG